MRRDRFWVMMGLMAEADEAVRGLDVSVPNAARMYDYFLLRHEALRYRVGVRDPRRQAVAAV